jgi:hypothetical protein
MSSESVYQVSRSWVDVGSFHTRLVVGFMIFTASVRNILDFLCTSIYFELASCPLSGGNNVYVKQLVRVVRFS